MSGFASFAHVQATSCRSPPTPTSQPIRTSPLKSSFVPPSIPSSSRSASPDRADSDGTNSDAGILSDDASDDTGDLSSDAESDLVFFGTPTAQQLDAIARLSHAIPGTPGFPGTPTSSTAATFASPFATPSRKVRRVKKRNSREYLRRQTIVHQPYLATPVRSAAGQDRDEAKAKAKGKGKARAIPQEQAQDRQAGKKVWPGGFFELLQDENRGEDEEGESEYAPTPVRFASSAKGQKGRRTTLSPERVHHDCELTFDFHRLGLSTPVPVGAQSTFAEETHRWPRRSSSASSGLTGGSEMGDVQEMEFSADEELADSDKENCPAPYDQDRHPVEAENQEAEMQIRTDGLLDASFTRAVIFEEDEQGVARVLDMGGLRIDDYGDEDVGGVMDSDDGELSDSSADMERGSPPPEEDDGLEGPAAASLEDDPAMTPETEEGAAEAEEEGEEERAAEGAEEGAKEGAEEGTEEGAAEVEEVGAQKGDEEGAGVEARSAGEVTGQDEIQGEGELGRAGAAVCAQSDSKSGEDASPTVSRALSPLALGTTSPIVSAAASPALSQTSPASSATSSPLPMARAPARIPVIPHFSPILDIALPPSSLVSDLQHDTTHAHPAHFESPSPFSDPASLSGLPSRPRQPLYATPTESPYVTAPSRPIRTPVPLSTPTPGPRSTSGAGPALSTPTTRSRGNLGVPSKLALRSQLMSSTKTVPQTIAKAREQAESRKESPETAALKQKMREEQREAAMLASAVKPRAVSVAVGATGQSALSTSVSARGRLGMGPPTRPGSAMSVSSSTSTATGSTAEQRSISSRSMPSGKSGSSASASASISASSRSAVSRSIPLASRSTSASTRARPAGVAMLDRPASVTSVSSASSTASRPQQTAGGRLATDKRSASASTSASARSVLGTRTAPSLSGSTARNAPRPPTAVTKQSSLPSRLTDSGPLSASNLNAAPSAARVSPTRLGGLKRPRSAVPPAAPRTAVAVSSGPISTGGAVRGALGAHGPPARVVGNRTIPLMSTRPVSPPSPVLHAVADIPSPVAQPSHFMTLYTEPPHFEIGAQPVAVPSSVMRPSGGYGLGGAACRPAPGSMRKNKMFMGTPSRGRTGVTPSKRPAVRPQPIPSDNVFRSIAAGGIASDRRNGNGPEHFVSSLDSPAGHTRSRPDGSGDTQPASSPSKPARGSSEDFAEVSSHAASSSETGSSPVKRSGKMPSPPEQASSPDEPPSSPPVTRSASQSPTNKAKAKRATSAPASRAAKTTITKPTPSRPASRTDTIVPNMTEKELKTKTAFNTAKNEKRQCAIDRQVIHIDAPRPPSPTSKIPTTAAREEKEKKMGRDERARRRKQDEEDAKADLGDMLVKREVRLQAPGDEEAWVYEDGDVSKEEDVSGPARKRTKTSHEEGAERAKRRVKWDKGVVVIRDFGEGLGKLAKPKSDARSGSALGGSKDGNSPDAGSSSMGSQSLRMKSILSVERRDMRGLILMREVELDQYGNLVTTKTAFAVKPQKVVVQAIFYQGEEPYVAPAASTRGKKKSV